MDERRGIQRGRTLLGGKIVFNGGRSAIDCKVRNLSDDGACLEVESQTGIPVQFQLVVTGGKEPHDCKLAWQSDHRMGVSFERKHAEPQDDEHEDPAETQPDEPDRASELMRGHMLALRAALDEVRFGVVLLDHELRAQFINRAFRKIWRLPDHKAESKPPFVALMYHGRDNRAYDVPAADIDAYVAERVEQVKRGDPAPRDLRLTNGEVLRFQCAILPNGGRMLSYTYVTDIVRHSDELDVLRHALDVVQDGVVLLDPDLNIRFMNQAGREFLKVPDHQTGTYPPFSLVVGNVRNTGVFDLPPDELETFIAARLAMVRAGDPTPYDLRTSDGRCVRARCTVMPDGGRMLTYCDVTDLARHADELETLATTDVLTGMSNRRQFMALADAEWSRFQRYQRPLSLLMIDIDHFKMVNDRFGHDAGDKALTQVSETCRERQRTSDIAGRIGGEEFALLLPETDITQAVVVAERIRGAVLAKPFAAENISVPITVSIGVAAATLSMSGISALMKAADRALYDAKAQGRNRVMLYSAARMQPIAHAAE